MAQPIGLGAKVQSGRCMAKGCQRTALYRNASTARMAGNGGHTGTGGYCSAHRDQAVNIDAAVRGADHVVDRFEAQQAYRDSQ